MSAPRDLSLERFDDRDGVRRPQLGKAAMVGSSLAGAGSASEVGLSYEALIDAVFTAPGALEWLSGLRRAVAAMLADMDSARRGPASSHAIRKAPPA
jgi:hypothetical protein